MPKTETIELDIEELGKMLGPSFDRERLCETNPRVAGWILDQLISTLDKQLFTDGKEETPRSRRKVSPEVIEPMIRGLRRDGFTYRQIARKLKYIGVTPEQVKRVCNLGGITRGKVGE